MYVKQISVFLENTKGSLAEITRIIGEGGIDLIALTIADTQDFGILRGIVSDTGAAVTLLREAGYTVSLTDVLAASVPDVPGGLSQVLSVLSESDISIEYLYSFVRKSGTHAMIIFRVQDIEKAHAALTEFGASILDQEQVRAL